MAVEAVTEVGLEMRRSLPVRRGFAGEEEFASHEVVSTSCHRWAPRDFQYL